MSPGGLDAGAVAVFGASSGIGAALVRRLRPHGVRVLAASRSGALGHGSGGAEPGDRAAADGGAVRAVRCDVRRHAEVHATLAALRRDGPVAAVVNCAGVGFYAPLDGDHHEQWREIVDTNLLGALHVLSAVRCLLPELEAFVHVSSLAAHRPSRTPGNLVYSVSKKAAHAAVEAFRAELRGAGRATKIGIVTPGYVAGTGFEARFFDHAPERRRPLIPPGEGLDAAAVAEVIHAMLTQPPAVELGEVIVRPRRQPD